MTREKFIEAWKQMDDEMRVRWLIKIKDNQNNPEYSIAIDNDDVYLVLLEEDDFEDDVEILHFDEFGYHLILDIFRAIGLKAEMV